MQIELDENGYVKSFSQFGGFFENGKEVEEPKDFEHFDEHYRAYRYNGNGLEFDKEMDEKVQLEKKQDAIRVHREEICFPIINRGSAWYDTLTKEQYNELLAWYNAWLDATETLIEPEPPEWLK